MRALKNTSKKHSASLLVFMEFVIAKNFLKSSQFISTKYNSADKFREIQS